MITRPGVARRPVLRRARRARAPATACSRCCPVGAQRAAVVTQAGDRRGRRPRRRAPGVHRSATARTPSTSAPSRTCAGDFARWGLTRGDVVVAVGGGVVTDTAGFAAAVLPPGRAGRARPDDAARPGRRRHRRQDRREPARGQEPRRRVLAAVGGAVRHRGPRHAAAREYRSGLARWPSTTSSASTTCSTSPSTSASPPACGARPRWSAPTSARAAAGRSSTTATRWPTPSRPPGGYDLRHGEAVGIGLVYAAELALPARPHRRRPGRPSTAAVVAGYDLPIDLPAGVDADELVDLIGRDKKAVDGPHVRARRARRRRAGDRRRPRRSLRRRPGGRA